MPAIDVSKLKLDLSGGLTLGEVMWFEDACGLDVSVLWEKDSEGKSKPAPARAMAGLVYIAAKRHDPRTTVADVRAVNLNDMSLLVVEEPAPLPPPPLPDAGSD